MDKRLPYVLTRRRQAYIVPQDKIVPLLTGQVRATNVPDDAMLVGAEQRMAGDYYLLIMTHASFPVCEPGCEALREPLELVNVRVAPPVPIRAISLHVSDEE